MQALAMMSENLPESSGNDLEMELSLKDAEKAVGQLVREEFAKVIARRGRAHGAKTELAKEIGVTMQTLGRFLNEEGKHSLSRDNQKKIAAWRFNNSKDKLDAWIQRRVKSWAVQDEHLPALQEFANWEHVLQSAKQAKRHVSDKLWRDIARSRPPRLPAEGLTRDYLTTLADVFGEYPEADPKVGKPR